ncbi:SulP family inorganic anion transporter [Paraburkholderia silviterrae]|uniref:Cyclic nucleotide-binding domain-containing protein n=1 Tax=Paraburkholderia silviterrae TaxID=2528715 RepID=A0A4R5M706_9BURK|nr:SulP family inorganic anion transporter [Paraburkholderia silviterrae]TDG21835.1 cyclic nucleotide-binding domain-containing protein [Paraburkholderia silviterrae]
MKPGKTVSVSDVLPRSRSRVAGLPGDLAAGAVSALVMLCYAMSLGTMIFSADLARYAMLGVPTALVSCVVTALVIALTSSMRLNIGGPDSNAAAFLAGVAAGVASSVRADGGSSQTLLLTVLIAIALCSLVTGIVLYAIGSSRRSRSLQFLPYPVLGGFLAGTGYLLLAGAFRVMTGEALQWHTLVLLTHLHWLAWLPALVVGVLATVLTRSWKHVAALPLTLAFGIVLFYVLLRGAGLSIDEARGMGLLLPRAALRLAGLPELHLSAQLAHGGIDWQAIAAHLPESLVVTSASAVTILMNSTAIGAATGEEVDLNREMRAAGLANLASGLLGGMVGYQSFNRSMLNARVGATSRLAGVFASLACLVALAALPGLVALFPVPVLVGLQLFMGLRLLVQWLVGAWAKLSWYEYLLVPVILGTIAAWGVIIGVVAGVVAACVMFTLLYGRVSCIRMEFDLRARTSNVERNIEETEALRGLGAQVCGMCLQGFLFFGTANSILQRLRERLAKRHAASVRFVVLDFASTQGIDASVSISFVKLRQLCAAMDADLILTALPLRSRDLLTKTGTLNLRIREFDTLDAGLEWIEDQLLASSASAPKRGDDLHAMLAPHFTASALNTLSTRLEVRDLLAGQPLFLRGEPGDALYIIERGRVAVLLPRGNGRSVRLRACLPGTVVGEMAMYTQQPRSADVFAEMPTRVRRLSLAALAALEQDDPAAAQQFHRFMVKVIASRLALASEALRAAY